MNPSFIAFAVAAAVLQPCAAFLSLPFNVAGQPNPSLAEYAQAQEKVPLKISLDIGQVEMSRKSTSLGSPVVTGTRLGIDGMLVELRGGEDADYRHPSLPGANGPNPGISSGPKAMRLLKEGRFVDLTGSRVACMENGVWEMVWRNSANAGALICGFEVPEDVKRNDAKIPKGRLFMTFPLWTSDSLRDLRARKEEAEEKAAEAVDRLKEASRRMDEESNPLMKAWHFRQACKASEDLDYSGHSSYKSMPLDRDMIELGDGLRLCSLGTVWTKRDGLGVFGGDRVLLGSATAAEGDGGGAGEKEVVSERELKPVAYDGLRP